MRQGELPVGERKESVRYQSRDFRHNLKSEAETVKQIVIR